MECATKIEQILAASSLEDWNLYQLNDYFIELKNTKDKSSISGNILQLVSL
jgi:hypothetical protein